MLAEAWATEFGDGTDAGDDAACRFCALLEDGVGGDTALLPD